MKIQLSLLFLATISVSLPAETARDWQPGKVTDASRAEYQSGASGRVNSHGSSAGYSESAEYQKTQTVVIEGSEYFYTIQEDTGRAHLSLLPPKLTNLTVNAPVRYAVEKQKLYVIADDGKEHKFEIVKRVLKPKP